MSDADGTDDATWEAFRRTRVRIVFDGGACDLAPAAVGTTGAFPRGVVGPIHVVTAQNPMGRPASDDENARADATLAAELSERAGGGALRIWRATGYGGGPLHGDTTWQEDGYAVAGMTSAAAIDLARRYRQRAIFTWFDEPDGFRLVACDGSADEPRGWTTTPTPLELREVTRARRA